MAGAILFWVFFYRGQATQPTATQAIAKSLPESTI